ncbi:MAG: 30S ribosomal protein S24e [Candidatus Bathyarchaeota archaeon]|nr:30S ribosomal protein S24e [Candidatus Bathyarchaeota archaeon]
MKLEILAEKENPLLKRKEIQFQVDHDEKGSTPPRLEVRRALADTLKINVDQIFVKKLKTKTGTHVALGEANIYESADLARRLEPAYVIKRNIPPEKPKEEEKK